MRIVELQEIVHGIATKFQDTAFVTSEVWETGPTWVFTIYWLGDPVEPRMGARTSIAMEVDPLMIAITEEQIAEVTRLVADSVGRAFDKWKAKEAIA